MVGAELIWTKVMKMTELPGKNKFNFAWSLIDMSGLDSSVFLHKLNINLNAKKIVEKKRAFTPKRQKAIITEIE